MIFFKYRILASQTFWYVSIFFRTSQNQQRSSGAIWWVLFVIGFTVTPLTSVTFEDTRSVWTI